MQVAKGAVPIWIMPQDTAVTFFFPDASLNNLIY
jgi:flavoprotein